MKEQSGDLKCHIQVKFPNMTDENSVIELCKKEIGAHDISLDDIEVHQDGEDIIAYIDFTQSCTYINLPATWGDYGGSPEESYCQYTVEEDSFDFGAGKIILYEEDLENFKPYDEDYGFNY